MKSSFKNKLSIFASRNILPIILVSILLAGLVSFAGIYYLAQKLLDTHAQQQSQLSFEILDQARVFYSDNVTDRIGGIPGITVDHNYRHIHGGVPNPATFTIDLGEELSDEASGASYRLFSAFPFPNREASGGARDNFEREALAFLTKTPDKSFSRRDVVGGQTVFRYAEAIMMEASCLGCHNSLPDSPKKDWKLGDVRGVLRVSQPLDELVDIAQKGLGLVTFAQILVGLMMLFIFVVVRNYMRSVNQMLELEVDRKTEMLKKLSETDCLTNLGNRGALDEALKKEWNRLQRLCQPMSILFIDIDFFKKYNDSYGHPAGDECLKLVASCISSSFMRSGDTAYRYGGEEFAVILPNTAVDASSAIAGGILKALSDLQIPHIGSKISDCLTLSIGIASTVPDGV